MCKNGKNKEFGAFVKTKKANKTRVYSIFQIGRRWLQKCYFSKVEKNQYVNLYCMIYREEEIEKNQVCRNRLDALKLCKYT